MRKGIMECIMLALLCILFAACIGERGTKGSGDLQTHAEMSGSQEGVERSADAWQYFSSQIIQVPEGVTELENALPEGQWISLGVSGKETYSVDGDVVRRLLSVWCWDGQDEDTMQVEKIYQQTLKPPYQAWDTMETTHEELAAKGDVKAPEKEQWDLMMKTVGGQVVWNRESDGKLYFGDKDGIWTMENGIPVLLINLKDADFAFTEVTGFLPGEEEFILFGKFGRKEYLVRLKKSEEPIKAEKQEILFVDSIVGVDLKNAIAEFNMMNQDYRIVIEEAGMEDFAQFRQRLQLEVTSGKGPDILGWGVFLEDWVDYAEKGYLEPLEDVFSDEEDQFWDFVLESGMVNGKRYAVPNGCNLIASICSEEFVRKAENGGNPDSVHFRNAREMMDAVRKAGADVAMRDVMLGESSAFELMYDYGIKNVSDATYIDWERGISHLDEVPFIELLQFAKDYTEKADALAGEELQENLQSGRIAFAKCQITDMSNILYLQALFQDEEILAGFPGEDDGNCYAIMSYLMVNQASGQKEGAKEFLRYLMSREGQNALAANGQASYGGAGGALCLRKDAFEEAVSAGLEAGIRNQRSGRPSTDFHEMGEGRVKYYLNGFSQKNVSELRMLMEHAKPYENETDVIEAILSEETAAFFEGGRSAAEVAEICHKRVQLYLDEN